MFEPTSPLDAAADSAKRLPLSSSADVLSTATVDAHTATCPPATQPPEVQSSTVNTAESQSHATRILSKGNRSSRPIEPEFEKVIFFKARRLARLWPFRPSDRNDLRQSLRLAWLATRDDFDPSKGSNRCYFKTIIERTAAKLRRVAVAEARRFHSQPSWDALLEGPRGCRIEASGDRRQLDIGHDPLAHVDAIQIKQDVPHVMKLLPPPEAELWQQVADYTITELHRKTGTPETTLSSRVSKLRKRFETPRFRDLL